MTTAPYFPLYLKDWLMDTRGFTHEDKGVLVNLLVVAWERGGLPTQPEAIRKLAGCTRPAWRRCWPTVQVNWIVRDDLLIFPKLEVAREYLEKRSTAAKAKAEKRWNADAAAMLQHSHSNTEAMQCRGNAYETTNNKQHTPKPPLAVARSERALNDERFETFWTAYPNKVGKQDAAKVFAKLKPDHDLLATILDAITRRQASGTWADRRYIPGPDKWLRGRRWEDILPFIASSPVRENPRVEDLMAERAARMAANAVAEAAK